MTDKKKDCIEVKVCISANGGWEVHLSFCKSHNSFNLGAFALGNNPEPGEGQFSSIVC